MTGWILKLSISVVCYDSSLIQLQSLLDSLIESIKHLRTHYELPTIPIFIIDNSDEVKVTPELYRWGKIRLEERNAELYLISGHGNIGYGRGHNLVLNRIDSDFHLLLNPDVHSSKIKTILFFVASSLTFFKKFFFGFSSLSTSIIIVPIFLSLTVLFNSSKSLYLNV